MRTHPRSWTRTPAATALVLLAAWVTLAPARAADPPTQPQQPATPAPASQSPPQVRVTTSMGEFVIELMPDRAPLTVANFLRYVREGFYSGTLFHRVIANFVIQGGGHSATDYKLKPVHDPVVNESGNGLQNKRGMVGLARGESPHSGNAQIYVNLVDNPDLDPLPTRWGYAVFGKVVQGMDVVDRIGVTPTGPVGPFKSDAPLKPVVIEKMEVVDSGSGQSSAPVTPPAPTATQPTSPDILSPK
ncbi:MAG TPA: peptidylprolyl isomerase [Steroidobacteraceae bacterium]|nr:peptidylprolyl isomerase [Steroidobacteraceae bacterium]